MSPSDNSITAEAIRSGLKTGLIGCRVHGFEEVGSTNDVAFRLATEGAPEGTVVYAESQSEGHGRRKRKWVSPGGKGIWFSLILRPGLALREIPRLYILASLAVAEAIERTTGLPVQVKWPNDLVIRGRKVGGLLIEPPGKKGILPFLILGVGINVNVDREALPPYLRKRATSLKEESGREVPRLAVLREVLRRLDRYYSEYGKTPITFQWEDVTVSPDLPVALSARDGRIRRLEAEGGAEGAFVVTLTKELFLVRIR